MASQSKLFDYQVRFLDAEGVVIDDLPLLAESLAVAGDCATALATELGATNFYITSKPDKQVHG